MVRRGVIVRRVAVTLAVLCLLYVGSYFVLTRWSASILSRQLDAGGFWYVPVDAWTMKRNDTLRDVHRAAAVVYYPLWTVDHRLNGFHEPAPIDYIDPGYD